MIAQVFEKLSLHSELFTLPFFSAQAKNQYSLKNYGYEADEDEIVSGMLDRLPEGLTFESIPEVEPEEFEAIFGYFLS